MREPLLVTARSNLVVVLDEIASHEDALIVAMRVVWCGRQKLKDSACNRLVVRVRDAAWTLAVRKTEGSSPVNGAGNGMRMKERLMMMKLPLERRWLILLVKSLVMKRDLILGGKQLSLLMMTLPLVMGQRPLMVMRDLRYWRVDDAACPR